MARVVVTTYTTMWGETTWESGFDEYSDEGLLRRELSEILQVAADGIFEQYESKEDK